MERRDRKVITVTPAASDYLPPVGLSHRRFIVGPYWGDRHRRMDGDYIHFGVPFGAFDARVLLKKGFAEPDLATVTYTFGSPVMPRNLARLGCPVVLIAGDTHHGVRPIQELIKYAHAEPFAKVLTANNPQHVHWLVAAGLPRPGWWPSPDVQYFPQEPFQTRRKSHAIFIGQVGKWHARRNRSIQAIREAGLPVRAFLTDSHLAPSHYAQALITLNLTLNGDTNARVTEVLAAGGCLVTDRLAPQSGMHALFTEGEHFVGFEDDEELVERVREYLANPAAALDIARSGHQEYVRNHLPERRVEQFWEYFEGKSDELERLADHDRRVGYARRAGKVSWSALVERLQVYEYLQEQVRTRSGVRVLYLAHVPPVTVADTADLGRLHRAYVSFPDQHPQQWEALREMGVANQVTSVRLEGVVEDRWDLIVAGADDLSDPRVVGLLSRVTETPVALVVNGESLPPSRLILLAHLGRTPDSGSPTIYRSTGDPSMDVKTSTGRDAPAPVLGENGVDPGQPEPVPASKVPVIADEAALDPLHDAHQRVIAFPWKGVAEVLPESINGLISTGLLKSLETGAPVDVTGAAVPGFVHAATDFLETWIRPDWRVHVWGPALDRAWWADRVAQAQFVLSLGVDRSDCSEDYSLNGMSIRTCDPLAPEYLAVPLGQNVNLVVVGGEQVDKCAQLATAIVREDGVIVLENSDRRECADAVTALQQAGWGRIDFWGILPRYLFRGCTSVFFRDRRYMFPHGTPDQHQRSLGPSFAQQTGQ